MPLPGRRAAQEGVVMHGMVSRRQRIYLDQTHIRKRVTGIERVTLDLFSPTASLRTTSAPSSAGPCRV